MAKALIRENKRFHISLLDQLTQDYIKELSQEKNRFFIFTDLGSGHLEYIQRHLSKKDAIVIICDHHQIQGEVKGENIFHLNPLMFGIEENISGSGVTYILARAVSPENRDLSELGIIGAVGDSQMGSIEENWGLCGLNREILKDAEKTGKIKVSRGLRIWGRYTRPVHKALEYSIDPYIPGISGSESNSVQFLKEIGIELKNNGKWRCLADLTQEEQKRLADGIIKERIFGNEKNPEWIFGDVYELVEKEKEFSDAGEFATILNACGKMKKGYIGVAICLNNRDSFPEAREIFNKYKREIGKAMEWCYVNRGKIIKETENGVYVIAGGSISEHLISNVVSIIHKSWGFSPEKPLLGFAFTENGKVKISARISRKLIEKGFSLKDMMMVAAKKVNGEGGGHAGAAGAIIPKEYQKRFIEICEGFIIKWKEKIENNINPAQQEELNTGERDGSDIKRTGIEREGKRGKKKEEGRGEEEKNNQTYHNKKMERQGLVRYFGS